MIGDILQPTHLLFVLVVALLVLGPKRLPEAGRALGKGIRDFKTARSGDDEHQSSIPAQTTVVSTPPYQAPAPAQAVATTEQPPSEAAEQPAEAAHPFV